jgi:hypothetical protein
MKMPATIRSTAKIRSDHGALLKNSHHMTSRIPQASPTITPKNNNGIPNTVASGKSFGNTNRARIRNTTMTTPGQSRSGLEEDD